jgi:glutamate N-acetyltransferase/amino-acid N-acetyltransferase
VALLVCDAPAVAAAAFTTNKVFAAPIVIGRRHVARGVLSGVVVNSGNANACTGRRGQRDALEMCQLAARHVGGKPRDFLPSSTGIIGHFLPMARVRRGIVRASSELGNSRHHADQFADAILTTDTRRKGAAERFKLGRQTVTIAGVCKGSGMIGPRLSVDPLANRPLHATMLAYLTTDAKFSLHGPLTRMLGASVEQSFNAVTIDDHASTNDTAAILASGASGALIADARSAATFSAALAEVCRSLAYQIAADGEGASRVVIIQVKRAKSLADARIIARTIANSPLVKCAMNGSDPNWGRIVSAAGFSGAAFDPERCELTLQGVPVFRRGQPLRFDSRRVSKLLSAPEVRVELSCGAGKHDATIWTCDLSREYVAINADYHT